MNLSRPKRLDFMLSLPKGRTRSSTFSKPDSSRKCHHSSQPRGNKDASHEGSQPCRVKRLGKPRDRANQFPKETS